MNAQPAGFSHLGPAASTLNPQPSTIARRPIQNRKSKFENPSALSQQGSVLVVTLVIAALFGIFLFSYLYLVRNQKTLISRSQAWNASIGMAEAGIEEALAQLNPAAPQEPVVDRTANGWGAPAGGLYGPVTRNLAGGSYSVLYTTNFFPVLYATGYVTIPSIPATLSRAVRVTTRIVPLFTVAMAAIGNIDMNGNNLITDSFNSSLTNLSNNGLYDPSKTSTNGNVASIGGVIDVGNADINGALFLGPTATNTVKNNGVVTGGVTNDFNATFPDVQLPEGYQSWLTPSLVSQLIGSVTYNYVFLVGGDYVVNNLSGAIYVGTNAVVRLRLTGNANPTTITVAGPGAGSRLTIYMDGPAFNLSGQNTVAGGVAMNFSYFGTTNNTSVKLSGNASFTGTIYAPEADLTLGGGGSDNYDFVGSTVTKTVSMNGHFSFHFDEALLNRGPARGYSATSWTEL